MNTLALESESYNRDPAYHRILPTPQTSHPSDASVNLEPPCGVVEHSRFGLRKRNPSKCNAFSKCWSSRIIDRWGTHTQSPFGIRRPSENANGLNAWRRIPAKIPSVMLLYTAKRATNCSQKHSVVPIPLESCLVMVNHQQSFWSPRITAIGALLEEAQCIPHANKDQLMRRLSPIRPS